MCAQTPSAIFFCIIPCDHYWHQLISYSVFRAHRETFADYKMLEQQSFINPKKVLQMQYLWRRIPLAVDDTSCFFISLQ